MEGNKTKVLQPLRIAWTPKEDITTFELAQCMPYLISMGTGASIMPYQVDESLFFRHFTIDNPNNQSAQRAKK